MTELRVMDFATVGAVRSQSLWHAVAYGVSAGAPSTLAFTRPAEPFVCLGYHRRLSEVDVEYCADEGLAIVRRMVGGGPVYLDPSQLFFQIVRPVADVPPIRARALRALLEPVVAAFRRLDVDAAMDEDLEICVEGRKICGHGAGQIDDAVVVCGNLIERFDHARATRILALGDQVQREQTAALMRRYVSPTPIDAGDFRRALVEEYAGALGLEPAIGTLTDLEHRHLRELDQRLVDPGWLAGPSASAVSPAVRQVKVRAGVWTLAASHDGARVCAAVVRSTVDQVRLFDRELNGATSRAEAAVTGVALHSVGDVLEEFGESGRRLAAAFAAADPERL